MQPDLIDVPMEVFGGYCPAINPRDLPPGAAVLANDVTFPMGAVGTRGGLKVSYGPANSPLPAAATVNGLKTYLNTSAPGTNQQLIALDSLNNLYQENPQGTLNLLAALGTFQNLFMNSTTLFGREYLAFSANGLGKDLPRQYDGTNLDRLSRIGPAVSSGAVDENVQFNIAAAGAQGAAEITLTVGALSQVGNLVTATITAISGTLAALTIILRVGDQFQVTGAGVAGYNGTWTLLGFITVGNISAVQFLVPTSGLANSGPATINTGTVIFNGTVVNPVTYVEGQKIIVAGVGATAAFNGTWPVRGTNPVGTLGVLAFIGNAIFGGATSGGGTLTNTGSVSAGLHQVSVAFITRQGLITKAAPPSYYQSAGNQRAVVTPIPTGPADVVARLLLFTPVIVAPAKTGPFFSLPNAVASIGADSAMLINDNVTTTATVDFSDTVLQAGFSANYLFSQLELGESASLVGYNSRVVSLGELARISNFLNMSFAGGFVGNAPAGWTLDAVSGAGGSQDNVNVIPGAPAAAYRITGDGATVKRGMITQGAFQDYLNVPILQTNTGYTVSVRALAGGGLLQGNLVVELFSPTAGSFGLFTINFAQLTAQFQQFSGILLVAPGLNPVPADTVLRLYGSGTLTNAGYIVAANLEVIPTKVQYNFSTARFSHAFNPESFDATTGQVQVRPGDGQTLRAAYPLRNNLYLAKDHYLCYVTDDGQNEPAAWPVNEVSSTIGICGPNACDWTEEWAVFAERVGLHIQWGSDPVKLTPEIQVDALSQGRVSWASINWAAATTLWVRIDKVNKQILVGAPINGAATPNVIFMLDYRWLETAQAIAESPLVTYSSFTGKILSHGRGRRWAIWNISANAMTFAERVDGTAQPFFGNGAGNGKLYQQLDVTVQASDDGAAISSFWQSYFTPSHFEEQGLRLGAARKLLGYLTWQAIGVGSLLFSIQQANRITNLRAYTLSTAPTGDGGRLLNLHGERFSIQAGTNLAGSWFKLEKLIPWMRKEAAVPVRGINA